MQKRRRNNYLHLNIKLAFHQKNSFGKRLKFRRDFIIYRKKIKKIKNLIKILALTSCEC